MSAVEFRDPRYGDIAAIWPRLREIEKVELACGGMTPKGGLRASLQASEMAMTVTVDGRPEGIFGCAPVSLMDGLGRPWFLCTDEALKHRRAWLIDAPRFLAQMEAWYPRLENVVHAHNTSSIRWLQRLGFVIDDELRQVAGHPFRRFTKGF
jgi:hypothetical protein